VPQRLESGHVEQLEGRTVAASVGCSEDTLAVTAHETGDIDPACLKIDVTSRRVIRVDA